MKRLKIVWLSLIFSLAFSFSSFAAVVEGINASNGVCKVYYSGSITCRNTKLSNPPRFVVDLVGVDKCGFCRQGVKIIKDNNVLIRSSLHIIRTDRVVKYYRKPALRVTFVFGNDNVTHPVCSMDKDKGLVTVIYAKEKRSNPIIERVSFRKLKDFEMVVLLTNKEVPFKVKTQKNGLLLTVKASALKEALIKQEFDNVSDNIKSILAMSTGNGVNYIISLKKGAFLKKYYSDKRHIYLIFPARKTTELTETVENSLNKTKRPENVQSQAKKLESPVKGVLSNTNKVISFDVRDAQLKDIFRVFAEISGLNFVIGDDVKGTLTMKLRDVPINRALNLILQQEGLVAERKGNIVIIETASRYQRQKSQEIKALEDKRTLERMKNAVTRVINLNYVTPDYAIKIINRLLYDNYNNEKDKGGFIVSDVQNNSLICHDTRGNIEKVEKIVKFIDRKKKAVEIDARIVEISKDFERQLGIQWGGNFFNNKINSSNTFIGVGGINSPVDVSGGLPPAESFSNDNFIVNLPATLSSAPTSVVSLAVGNVRANYNLDLKLTMGELEGYTKVLSSPKVITSDNEPAKIESGQEIPYQETAGASGATSVSFKDATLSLEVTPHITNSNQVVLNIKVKKDSPDYSHSVSGEPPINTNEVDTTVVLNNGQTLVIGGLIQKRNEKTIEGVPGLMRIPLLGWLFKTKKIHNPQNELYIFVTPHVLKQ